MSPESESFEQLRRLLALKRYEQPPPGYFHHFSREVIVRIKAGEKGEAVVASWWSWEGSWLQRTWAAIESRPALAGAFGVAVCGFFTAGALLSDNPDANAEVAVTSGVEAALAMGTLANNNAVEPANPPWNQATPLEVSQPSLFQIQRFQGAPQPFVNVNYVPPN
jgi:hypothetical protein